ncbi:Type 1 glutamine amidotransferase-like domain-containing protein [Agromyces sp. MMS24-JH15]|uniref:Type 1 glutamine amidotransferase-like domain-containing protein n=1 Tax=Agromyces sp. MMS24-JH15 TaxID=3243765 RepID=UPI0037484B0A
MSVHLVGGGWAERPDGAEYRAFVAEARVRARAAGRAADASGRPVPRIAIVVVGEGAAAHADELVIAIAGGGVVPEVVDAAVVAVPSGGEVPAGAFADVDGVVVGGGATPEYRDALEPVFGELRRQVAAGLPYLGFSAGAAVAAERAIIGGWRIGGVPVAPEAASEGLDEVTVAPGIGLVDVAIDAHAAQWGTLSRLVAAVEAGLVEGGLAIDERTALVVAEGGLEVAGHGSVWRALPVEQGVVVSTMGA